MYGNKCLKSSSFCLASSESSFTSNILLSPLIVSQLVIIIQLLPGTQGIYGLLVGFIALSNIGILSGTPKELTVAQGLMMLAACLPIAVVGLVSAMHQGKTAVAAVGIVVKKPDQFGKAMLFPAMVETYAILALLVSILAVNGIKL